MASGIKLVGVFIFWAVLGLSWAVLNENVIDKLPTMFSDPYTLDKNTYDIMIWAWKLNIIGLCIGSAISILGQRGFKSAIVNSMVLFSGVFIGVLFWATFWTMTNVTIPNAFASGFNQTSNTMQFQGVYNAVFLIFVLGLTLLSFFTGGTAIIGRRRYRAQRVIPSGSYLPSGREVKSIYGKYRKNVKRGEKEEAKERKRMLTET